ncbi:MAG: VOC family protein [Ilumatobacteraceae bacterium]
MTAAPSRRTGTVVWIDLSTTDLDQSIHFYERLFGWHYDEQDRDMGSYIIARIDGGEVGGMMAQPPDDTTAGVPASWTVVVGDDHLETTLARTRELGGTVLQPPMSIPGGARIAVIADPSGAALSLMQSPRSPHGMAWDKIGAMSWVECLSRDPTAARGFYEELFGWKGEEGTGGYVVFHLDDQRVGGLMGMPASVPTEVASYWLVYFAVIDTGATCARAETNGGTVLEPAHDIEERRFAVLADPAGAMFAVLESRAG